MAQPQPLELNGEPLSISLVNQVARGGRAVRIGAKGRENLLAAHRAVAAVAAGSTAVYGINTGFGSLAHVRVPAEQLRQLQHNIVRSHAAGVGKPLPTDVVRGMLLILAASLCRGHSGVRVEVVERILQLLEHDITPQIPEIGSVGASGDLAPLAHAMLALLGEGDVSVGGKIMSAAAALKAHNLKPLELEAKEGLALLNGTHLMASRAALAFEEIDSLRGAAISAAAMSMDACLASHSPLDERIHQARKQPGQIAVAAAMRGLLAGSQIPDSHKDNDPRVQDPYGLRCSPQVIGAAFDQLDFARGVIERELGAVTDNPLVFAGGKGGFDIVSGGNFHGMPLALAMDQAKVALCHIAGISERRTFWILSGHDPMNRVKPHLATHPGLESGLMIVQYTAAACCNELQSLAHPASVGNVSTCGGIEDYNSFGPTSATQLARAVELCRSVIAIELYVMTQALEAQRPLRSGAGVEATYKLVRSRVKPLAGDRSPAPDLAAIIDLIK
ncbi:MAG: histidine ammonia-lyase [Planctomycetes bacterium]|nr:histidine ammonia-lyase [Planctomycetota bacterium]